MVYNADFPEGVRAAVELRGINVGRSRQPMNFDRSKLESALRCVMADFGVVDPPGVCAPRVSGYAGEPVDLGRDKVMEVTSAVMDELRRRGKA
jgi:4-hydroxy-tetrahydrodipicolinate synthase